ncbi:MAG: alpha/beta hydrolase [Clostridiales bacterium]|nr:alpha/beta hydrolase [Clostridiales bacterium]
MKKLRFCGSVLVVALFLSSCSGASVVTSASAPSSDAPTSEQTIAPSTTKRQLPTPTPEPVRIYAESLTEKERESITIGVLSPEHEYYEGAVESDPQIVDYVTEISIYDEEIDDTFIVHVALPPNFSSGKTYPLVVMTDGIWRLHDFTVLRKMMADQEIEELILVSVGYPNGYDYERIRERDFTDDPESFLHFLVDNLIPYISENHPVDPERITLTGHSLGGYFAFYALFHSDTIGKGTFESYLAASPWLQAMTGLKNADNYEQEFFERGQPPVARMYVTAGGQESVNYKARITGLCTTLTERSYDGLELTYDDIEGESHNSVFGPSVTDALRTFYGT